MTQEHIERTEELLNHMKENKIGEYLREATKQLDPVLEIDPGEGVIREELGRTPSEIAYMNQEILNVKRRIDELKLDIKRTDFERDLKKSGKRKEVINVYKEDLKKYHDDSMKLMEMINKGEKKLTAGGLHELIKSKRPDKPTQSFLEDVSNVETEEEQRQMFMIEERIIELEHLYGVLVGLKKKLEDKKFAVFAHKSFLEEERKNA